MNNLQKIATAAAVIVAAIAVLWIGSEDYEHQVAEHAQYIQDVCAGYHPDYLDAKPNCQEVNR
jgi:hypothetical protein